MEALPFIGQTVAASNNREFSAQQASNQMAFQREMSNTGYYRAAKDMEKAGLNRILAVGGPASTPAGSMGQGSMPADNTSSAVGAAELATIKSPLAKAQILEKTAQTANTTENIKTQKSQQTLNSANADKARVDKALSIAKTQGLSHDNRGRKIKNDALEALGTEAQILKEGADIVQKVGAGASAATGAVMDLIPGARSLKGVFKGKSNKIFKERRKKPKFNRKTGEIYDKRLY